jgi:hypothetical protein
MDTVSNLGCRALLKATLQIFRTVSSLVIPCEKVN